MKTTKAHDERIANMKFGSVYPHYVAKVEKKGRTEEELVVRAFLFDGPLFHGVTTASAHSAAAWTSGRLDAESRSPEGPAGSSSPVSRQPLKSF